MGYSEFEVTDHPYDGTGGGCRYVYRVGSDEARCGRYVQDHASPGDVAQWHLITTLPHVYQNNDPNDDSYCTFTTEDTDNSDDPNGFSLRTCGYPRSEHDVKRNLGAVVRKADVAQYPRQPMPDEARRGPVVTLLDEPVDPLGTVAAIGGIYTGKIARSKSEVTDDERRAMLEDMLNTVLDGALESVMFTFLVEGVGRDITHQMVRSRFSFFAQESLRFAVAEDWAQEVPLPPSLSQARDDDPAVGIWRKSLNAAEDAYNALVGAGMPAEEARKVLPHAITTRLYWTVSLRTLLADAGKRVCTQAQFEWRQIFAGVAKELRERAQASWRRTSYPIPQDAEGHNWSNDGWQYEAIADLLRPVCYQQGKCGFMAKFDRGCTIRERVDLFAENHIPSTHWHEPMLAIRHRDTPEGPAGSGYEIPGIDPAEWATDPNAARVVE